jgi:hypothetical protein
MNEPRSQHIVDLRSKLSRSSGYEHRSRYDNTGKSEYRKNQLPVVKCFESNFVFGI